MHGMVQAHRLDTVQVDVTGYSDVTVIAMAVIVVVTIGLHLYFRVEGQGKDRWL
jgi:hypothetical protein